MRVEFYTKPNTVFRTFQGRLWISETLNSPFSTTVEKIFGQY